MINLVLKVLFELMHVPGLRFLERYYLEINEKRGRLGQKIGDIEAERDAALKGAKTLKNLRKNIKGTKKRA